jgi:hypothetical protein
MDALIVLSGEMASVRAEIADRTTIVQEGSPRVLVVRGDQAALQRLATLPSVTTDEELAGPEGKAAREGLTPGERLFVDAWLQGRANVAEKRRVGDGKNWGVPGFEAP